MDLFGLEFRREKSGCLSCEQTPNRIRKPEHWAWVPLLLCCWGFFWWARHAELGVLGASVAVGMTVIILRYWIPGNIVGSRVLVYVGGVGQPKIHWHGPTRAAVNELCIAANSRVLELRSGGWFRRCAVLYTDGNVDGNWRVKYWKDGDRVRLIDKQGNMISVEDPPAALRIVSQFDSVTDFLVQWRNEKHRAGEIEHLARQTVEQRDALHRQLLVAVMHELDLALIDRGASKSPSTARLRVAIMKALGAWMLTRGGNMSLTPFSKELSPAFLKEWERVHIPPKPTTPRAAESDCDGSCDCTDH